MNARDLILHPSKGSKIWFMVCEHTLYDLPHYQKTVSVRKQKAIFERDPDDLGNDLANTPKRETLLTIYNLNCY